MKSFPSVHLLIYLYQLSFFTNFYSHLGLRESHFKHYPSFVLVVQCRFCFLKFFIEIHHGPYRVLWVQIGVFEHKFSEKSMITMNWKCIVNYCGFLLFLNQSVNLVLCFIRCEFGVIDILILLVDQIPFNVPTKQSSRNNSDFSKFSL